MKANFATCLAHVLKSEGGYVDDPRDPGGATNMGITRRTLAAWRHVTPYTKLPKSAVKQLTQAEAGDIYRARYWDEVSGDKLPSGLDLAVFDFAVNSGPAKAAMVLQAILGVATDGVIGPITLEAIGKHQVSVLISDLCSHRLAFLERLSTWPVYGNGWRTRVYAVRDTALELAHSPVQPQEPSDAPSQPEPPSSLPSLILSGLLAVVRFIVSLFARK